MRGRNPDPHLVFAAGQTDQGETRYPTTATAGNARIFVPTSATATHTYYPHWGRRLQGQWHYPTTMYDYYYYYTTSGYRTTAAPTEAATMYHYDYYYTTSGYRTTAAPTDAETTGP